MPKTPALTCAPPLPWTYIEVNTAKLKPVGVSERLFGPAACINANMLERVAQRNVWVPLDGAAAVVGFQCSPSSDGFTHFCNEK